MGNSPHRKGDLGTESHAVHEVTRFGSLFRYRGN